MRSVISESERQMSFQSFGKTEIMIAAALTLSVLVAMVFSAALKWNRERTKKNRNALIRNAAVFLFACILLLSALSLSRSKPQTEYAFDLNEFFEIARSAKPVECRGQEITSVTDKTVAVAMDEAFCFYYEENVYSWCQNKITVNERSLCCS